MEEELDYSVESCLCGYDVYKEVWTPNRQETLECSREEGNIHDPYAVAVTNTGSIVVGHVPRTISALCSIFILRGSRITCQITGD